MSISAGFTLTRTVFEPNHGRFWSCAGGLGTPLQRLSVFNNDGFQPLDTSTWIDPVENWTNVNEGIFYIDTTLNGLYHFDDLPQNVTDYCQCSLYDFGFSEWLYYHSLEKDMAIDYWHGYEQTSRPPQNWFQLERTPEVTFNVAEDQKQDIEPWYDPNDFQDTLGIQQLYTGDDVPYGSGNFGLLMKDEVTNQERLTTRNKLVKINDNGKSFVLRVIAPSASAPVQVRVYLVENGIVKTRRMRPLADELLKTFEAEVGVADTEETWQLTAAIEFETPAPTGKYYAMELGDALNFVNPKQTRIDWTNGPGDSDYSGPPSYTCTFPSLELDTDVIISLEPCKGTTTCNKEKLETVELTGLDAIPPELENGDSGAAIETNSITRKLFFLSIGGILVSSIFL